MPVGTHEASPPEFEGANGGQPLLKQAFSGASFTLPAEVWDAVAPGLSMDWTVSPNGTSDGPEQIVVRGRFVKLEPSERRLLPETS